MKMAINGTLILTPYKKTRELKQTEVATGFIATANKIGIEYLELLVDTLLTVGYDNIEVPKGAKIYFKEETLYTQKWSKQIYESEEFPEGFVIGNINDVLFIEELE